MAKFFSFARVGTLLGIAVFLVILFAPTQTLAFGLEDLPKAIGDALLKIVAGFVLTFSGWILGIVGVLFNWVVIKTVFQFGTYFGTTDGMLIAWGVMRDIANIGLLFSFIFMGVLLILNVEGGGGHGHGGGISAKRAIPRLIIFAVLLNFSLFATQGIIDVANAFGSQFAGLAGMECTGASTTDQCANLGMSAKVLQMAGIQTVWEEGVSTSGVVLLGLALFVIITAMVLLAASIMLIIRVVILTLLMVTSPIGFAGMVIPGLSGIAAKWWHALLSQSFFAPAMLLLMFISLKMAESLNPNKIALVNAFANTGPGNTGAAGNLEILVVFAVVIGLMLASLAVASKMGAMGAKFATNTAAGLTVGGVAFAGRHTVGRAAYASGQALRSTKFARSTVGRYTVGGLDAVGKGNFDMRSTAAGGALKGMGIDAGKGQHGGYDHIVHEEGDKLVKYGKSLKQTKEEKAEEARRASMLAGGQEATTAAGRASAEKLGSEVQEAEQAHQEQEQLRTQKRTTQQKRVENALAEEAKANSSPTATPKAKQAAAQAVAAAEKELEEMTRGHQELARKEQEIIREKKKAMQQEQEFYTGASAQYTEDIKANKANFKNIAQKDFSHRLAQKDFLSVAGDRVHVNEHASHELHEWADKSGTERALDKLNETLKKSGNEAHKDTKHVADAVAGHDDHAGSERH